MHFLCKHGDLSSDPRHLHRIQTWTCVCNPSVRRQRQAEPKSLMTLMTLSPVRDLNSGRIWWIPRVFSFTQPTLTWCWITISYQNQKSKEKGLFRANGNMCILCVCKISCGRCSWRGGRKGFSFWTHAVLAFCEIRQAAVVMMSGQVGTEPQVRWAIQTWE